MENETNNNEKAVITALKVKGGSENPTSPVGLSRSMLHVLNEHGFVELLSVGAKSLDIAVSAYKLANIEIKKRHSGIVLVCAHTEDQAMIGDDKTRRTITRVFPIKTKYVV